MRSARLLLILGLTIVVCLSACGGGGGGGVGPVLTPGGSEITTGSRPVHLAWVPENTSAGPARAAAPSVQINGRTYTPDLRGIISNLPVQAGEFLLLDDGSRIDPQLGPTDSLFVKISDLADPPARLLSQVWFSPRSGGGLDFRGRTRLRSAGGDKEQVFSPQTLRGAAAGQLVGRYLGQAEAAVAPELGRTPPARNLEQLFAPLPVNPFTGFSGEIRLTLEPAQLVLGPNSQGQLTPRIVDEAGTSAIVNAGWTTVPPEVVFVDITGLVTSRDVPGTVEVSARYENLFATAEVVVTVTVTGEEVTGPLLADTVWTPDRVWTVTGDVRIPAGRTLTVAGGTQIRFLPNVDNTGAGENPTRSEIIVEGTLEVNGFAANRTVIRSQNLINPGNYEYLGIRVRPGGRAKIENTDFHDGVYGVKVEGGSLDFRGNRFRHGQIGLYLDADSSFFVEGNEFEDCIAGIECHFITDGQIRRNYFTRIYYNTLSFYNSSPRVYGNILYRLTGAAVGCYNRSLPTLENNLISDCGTDGLIASVDSAPRLRNNIIDRCKGNGLFLIPGSRPRIENNIISNNNLGMAWRNGVTLLLDQNDFSNNSTFNFLNLDTRNDRYWDPATGEGLALPTVLTDSNSVFLYTLPYFLYEKPIYRKADWASPHLGDFRLAEGHPLLTLGDDSGPVGLIDALDLGTAAVFLGVDP